MKLDLKRHYEEIGRPFAIETSTTLEEPARSGPRKAETDDVTVLRLLRLYLISSVTILPEATAEELIPFCSLLEEDVAKTYEKLWQNVDPDEWDHIHLSFYTPEDFPDLVPNEETSLKMSAGLRRIKGLENFFENLEEGAREQVQEALKDPAFLKRFSELRRAFRQRLPESQRGRGKKIDLVSEVFRSVLTSPELLEDSKDAGNKVLSAVNGLVQFLEGNVDALALQMSTRPGELAPGALGNQIKEAFKAGSGMFHLANTVQVQKQRLAFLFQTSAQAGKLSPEEPGTPLPAQEGSKERNAPSPPQASAEPAQGDPRGQETGGFSLEVKLKDVKYDLSSLQKLLLSAQPYESCLEIILELLGRDEHKQGLSKLLPAVSQMLIEDAPGRPALEKGLAAVCDFVKETEDACAQDLLVEVLGKISPLETVIRTLQGLVVPRCGLDLAQKCLIRLAEKDPRGAMPLLFLVHREGKDSLQKTAEACLVRLASDLDHLIHWAAEYPRGLLEPAVLSNVIESLGPEQTLRSFKAFFTRASESQARRILQDFPAGIRQGETVFFAALEKAPPSIRKVAIVQLQKCPTPSVIATLIEILKGNNYKRDPDMEEVEAALQALIAIKDAGVARFLNEVLRSREGFRHSYRKDIRKTLLRLTNKQKALS